MTEINLCKRQKTRKETHLFIHNLRKTRLYYSFYLKTKFFRNKLQVCKMLVFQIYQQFIGRGKTKIEFSEVIM